VTLQEAAALLTAINSYDCRNALQAFFRNAYVRKLDECQQHIIKDPPEVNQSIQAGAAAEVYRCGFSDLVKFCDTQLKRAKA